MLLVDAHMTSECVVVAMALFPKDETRDGRKIENMYLPRLLFYFRLTSELGSDISFISCLLYQTS